MVTIASVVANGSDTHTALAGLKRQIVKSDAKPDFIYAFYGCDHDDDTIRSFLKEHFPDAAFLGGTSCSGVMNEDRLWGADSIGMLLIDDPEGDYGVASARIGDDPAAAAEGAIREALANAGCPGELSELV